MSVNWTKDQANVIASRRENLLVSAAAGSGKTAVLVARLISRLTDPEDPADIDEFLVVTFTRAAAAEMKERISQRILEELETRPDDEHLRRQLTLVNRARITTIDGFCSWVVRSYAPLIDVDMTFRIADGGEKKLMEADVMRRVMEEAHEEAAAEEAAASADDERGEAEGSFSKNFRAFLETFATGRDERTVEELIQKVYKTAMSLPYPGDYYELCRKGAAVVSLEDLDKEDWMAGFWLSIDDDIAEGAALSKKCAELMALPGAPASYGDVVAAYCGFFENLETLGHRYGDVYEAVRAFEKPRTGGGKSKSENGEIREELKKYKERLDKICGRLAVSDFPFAPELMLSVMQKSAGPLDMLVTMAERYGKALEETKRKKNVLDFSDLEHLALKVLRRDRVRTAAAREIAAGFKEVMIDEYQDSNYLQEEILTAVSTLEDGVDNYFCVGDVKQSIYSFRQARPDLFMEKFDRYVCREDTGEVTGKGAETGTGEEPAPGPTPGPAPGRRIDLHQNFRSRPEILAGVNAVFRRIMRREVGGITYDDAASLMTGTTKQHLETADGRPIPHEIEVMTVFTGEEDEDGAPVVEVAGTGDRIELEAGAVASQIAKLVADGRICDDEGHSRSIEYRDIVILLRTMEGVAEGFKKALEAARIPVVVQEKKGFFESSEVKTLLSFLEVIDNPRQDIPLAASMKSVIGGFTTEELAEIRGDIHEGDFYSCLKTCSGFGADEALRLKCAGFLAAVNDYRRRAAFTPIHALITDILRETGLAEYAAALPNGQQRSANLRMLVENAVVYEQTSSVGLFNFVRYIRSLEEQKEEMEVAALGENENAVRVVSIHKSKGLEYPIVFVCRLDSSFNTKDISSAVLTDPRYGLASDYVDYVSRVIYPTIKKEALAQKAQVDLIGEELRVLYVALTRAKLKLYLVGTVKNAETLEEKYAPDPEKSSGFLPAGYLARAKTRWDLLMPALLIGADEGVILMKEIHPAELITSGNEAREARNDHLNRIRNYDPETVLDPALRRALEEQFGYRYPFEDRREIPAKVSVSEIKMAHMEMGDESGLTPFEEADVVPLIPAFMQEEAGAGGPADGDVTGSEGEAGRADGSLGGAARGTVYHTLLSRLDLTDEAVTTGEGLARQLKECVAKGFLTENEAAVIIPRQILTLLQSPIGHRLIAAAKRSQIRREQPFTMSVPASAIRPEWPEDETVLIQGIIDVWFEEDGRLIVLDYKTDKVSADEDLIDRYRVQLDLYAEALTRSTGKTVAGKYLYSFSLGRCIDVPE